MYSSTALTAAVLLAAVAIFAAPSAAVPRSMPVSAHAELRNTVVHTKGGHHKSSDSAKSSAKKHRSNSNSSRNRRQSRNNNSDKKRSSGQGRRSSDSSSGERKNSSKKPRNERPSRTSRPTPEPEAPMSGECEPCESDDECESDMCEDGKCVLDSDESFTKCFPPSASDDSMRGPPDEPAIPDGPAEIAPPAADDSTRGPDEETDTPPEDADAPPAVPEGPTTETEPMPETAGECEPCELDEDCDSDMCEDGKCVLDTDESRMKCFPPPAGDDSTRAPTPDDDAPPAEDVTSTPAAEAPQDKMPPSPQGAECDICEENADCESTMCYKGNCVLPTEESRMKCVPEADFGDSTRGPGDEDPVSEFEDLTRGPEDEEPAPAAQTVPMKAGECDPCNDNADCESNLCYKGSCVLPTEASFLKCVPDAEFGDSTRGPGEEEPAPGAPATPMKAGECELCNDNADCESNLCYKSNCVLPTEASFLKCDPSSEFGDSTRDPDDESTPEVGDSTRGPEASSPPEADEAQPGTQPGGDDSTRGGPGEEPSDGGPMKAGECDSCVQDSDCETMMCMWQTCIYDTFESVKKCLGDKKLGECH